MHKLVRSITPISISGFLSHIGEGGKIRLFFLGSKYRVFGPTFAYLD